MTLFLLVCKENDESLDIFCSKASSSVSEMTASFVDGTILTEI